MIQSEALTNHISASAVGQAACRRPFVSDVPLLSQALKPDSSGFPTPIAVARMFPHPCP